MNIDNNNIELTTTMVRDISSGTTPRMPLLDTGMSMVEHGLKEMDTATRVSLAAFGLGALSALGALRALRAGHTKQAMALAAGSVIGIVAGGIGLWSKVNNLYQNVTNITSQEGVFKEDWMHIYRHSTQYYNTYGEKVGQDQYLYEGDCYQNTETRMMCWAERNHICLP